MSAEARWRLRADVVLRQGAQAWYLTDLRTGDVMEANETSSRVLAALQAPREARELVDLLVGAYPDAARDEVERDVRDVIEELRRMDLVEAA